MIHRISISIYSRADPVNRRDPSGNKEDLVGEAVTLEISEELATAETAPALRLAQTVPAIAAGETVPALVPQTQRSEGQVSPAQAQA